jgi:cell division protein FtsL
METKGEDIIEELMSEYAEYIDMGTINYLMDLMSKEEKKSRREIFREIFKEPEISREALYQSQLTVLKLAELKKRIIKEAFKRLNPDLVIKTLYGHMQTIFINFIIDVLSATADKINTDKDLAEFIREVLTKNNELLKEVRDDERRKIIEIIIMMLSLKCRENNGGRDK